MGEVCTRLLRSLAFQSLQSQVENNFEDAATHSHPGLVIVTDRNGSVIWASKHVEYWSGKSVSAVLHQLMPLASSIPDNRMDDYFLSWFTSVNDPFVILQRSVDVSLRGEVLHSATLFIRDTNRIAQFLVVCYVPVRDVSIWNSHRIARAEDSYHGDP
eukprot:ANDGO_07271.mRNA.1 hypothetical protein